MSKFVDERPSFFSEETARKIEGELEGIRAQMDGILAGTSNPVFSNVFATGVVKTLSQGVNTGILAPKDIPSILKAADVLATFINESSVRHGIVDQETIETSRLDQVVAQAHAEHETTSH